VADGDLVNSSVESERRLVRRAECRRFSAVLVLSFGNVFRASRRRLLAATGDELSGASNRAGAFVVDAVFWVAGVVLDERDGVADRVLKLDVALWGAGAVLAGADMASLAVPAPRLRVLARVLNAGGDE
jgi:hypothetical protein